MNAETFHIFAKLHTNNGIVRKINLTQQQQQSVSLPLYGQIVNVQGFEDTVVSGFLFHGQFAHCTLQSLR